MTTVKFKQFCSVFLPILLLFFLQTAFCQSNPNNTQVAEQLSRKIVDRIIEETSFELEMKRQVAPEGIQVIHFDKLGEKHIGQVILSTSKITTENDVNISLGVSYSQPFLLKVDDYVVFEKKTSENFKFHEIAYEIYEFNDSIHLSLTKGTHTVSIESKAAAQSKIVLCEIVKPGEEKHLKFSTIHAYQGQIVWPWCYTFSGLDSSTLNSSPDSLILQHHELQVAQCLVIKAPFVNRLLKKPNISFKKDNYAEWHYANGSMMLSILQLSSILKEKNYENFILEYCENILNRQKMFEMQYTVLSDFLTPNYRMFRKAMLDDTGGPVLPFAEMYKMNGVNSFYPLLIEMSTYVQNGQVRLSDGTLCRPEPEPMTVWADDLFMSVPFLVRMGFISGDTVLFNDVIKQVTNFDRYLWDSDRQLYKHSWNSIAHKQSAVHWSRANGWVLWAVSEALMYLPKSNPGYQKVLSVFQKQVNGLLKYQQVSGLWNQILTDSTSFEETSSTAMFIVGMARGIRLGWIDENYKPVVLKAFNGLITKISEDGIVSDICCGTGVSEDPEFYRKRKRLANDPRGLGAVLTALGEIINLEKK